MGAAGWHLAFPPPRQPQLQPQARSRACPHARPQGPPLKPNAGLTPPDRMSPQARRQGQAPPQGPAPATLQIPTTPRQKPPSQALPLPQAMPQQTRRSPDHLVPCPLARSHPRSGRRERPSSSPEDAHLSSRVESRRRARRRRCCPLGAWQSRRRTRFCVVSCHARHCEPHSARSLPRCRCRHHHRPRRCPPGRSAWVQHQFR
mmetsp:Transcript_24885/g.55255  ORF Transcript_24885/g.55255 Transcript_24885/m.55255 type:complete len:203 (-) Transcript_24885:57-665(-)